jgi:hypothetical protein
MNLTVALTTSRNDPKFKWWIDSLLRQCGRHRPRIIVVDYFRDQRWNEVQTIFLDAFENSGFSLQWIHIECMPTIWQGKYQITREPWWAKSAYLNSAICRCETETIAFCDDRSVFCDGWINSVADAANENIAVVGTYAKHANLKVENGVITDIGTVLGVDHRPQSGGPYPSRDWYGGHGALPLEWCLRVNGFSQDLCDSLGSEDSMFGVTLHNSGYPIKYDPRMKIIEDRTPGEIDGALKRADKGVSPSDKSHAIVSILRDKTSSQNSFDIRNLRDRVLAGEPFPEPSASHLDWFDGQKISEMV